MRHHNLLDISLIFEIVMLKYQCLFWDRDVGYSSLEVEITKLDCFCFVCVYIAFLQTRNKNIRTFLHSVKIKIPL